MRLFSTYHIDHDMTGIVAFVTRTVVFLALVVDLSSHIPVVVSPPCQVGLSPIETPSMTLSEGPPWSKANHASCDDVQESN